MKILFYGDSITDAGRNRTEDYTPSGLGFGYPYIVNAYLTGKHPKEYDVLNRGISGNRIVDLYARVKADVWNLKPDMLSILIGVNDIWHELDFNNGVDIARWEKIYRMLIEDTLRVLPDLKIVIMEPFVLKGSATEEKFDRFSEIKDYAAVAKKIAEDYKCIFVPLQKKLDAAAEKYGAEYCLVDGVHPAIGGAHIIAGEWLKTVLGESL